MKKRVDVTLDLECLEILKQAQKINPTKTNRSQLIEHAVKKVYQNKKEALRELAKEYQKKIMEIQDKIKELK